MVKKLNLCVKNNFIQVIKWSKDTISKTNISNRQTKYHMNLIFNEYSKTFSNMTLCQLTKINIGILII